MNPDGRYDTVLNAGKDRRAVLVWFCANVREVDKALLWLAQRSRDGKSCLPKWKALARTSGALTIWGGYEYRRPGLPDYQAACLVFRQRYWGLGTVVHESQHLLKALFFKKLKLLVRSEDPLKVDEFLACVQASLVTAIYNAGERYYHLGEK